MVKIYNLEEQYKDDFEYAVQKRREILNVNEKIPYKNYEYNNIYKKNCENIIGYIPLPLGYVGPIKINNNLHNIPIATTEGALVSSLNRGCKVLFKNGINTIVEDIGMSRAPLIKTNSINDTLKIKNWLEDNLDLVKKAFNSTTNYGKFKNVSFNQSGNYLHIRITATTCEAMGMNMLTKGSDQVIKLLKENNKNAEIISLSGNYCTDKKNSAINWILGRGKKVIAEAIIDEEEIVKTLKTNIDDLINLNINKNLIGSSIAGTIGGNNSQAANVVAGIFLATGQDAGHIGSSSSSILNLEKYDTTKLRATITMPNIEVGTIGGGTNLTAQKELLKFMNLDVNQNYRSMKLAEIIAGAVLAGELSLLSALYSSDLLKAHMTLNR